MISLFKVFSADNFDLVTKTLHSGFIGQGPRVEEFEGALKDALKLNSMPISTNSCTSALDLALHLIGVGAGDYVISTPQTCLATNTVIHNRGATIVWADVDSITGNIDALDVEYLVSKYNPKAIMAVDWAGRICDYSLLKSYGVPVIEDAAHAFGAPTDGDYICYSFQAIKHLTCGDGGALVAPDDQIERAKLLRWYGLDRKSGTAMRCVQMLNEIGYKYQMNDISASVGLCNLPFIRENVIKHRANAAFLTQHITNEKITIPPYDDTCAYWIFTIHCDTRDDFKAYLLSHKIEASLVHVRNDTQRKLRAIQTTRGEIPGVVAFSKSQLSIPCGWWVSESEREYIVETINKY